MKIRNGLVVLVACGVTAIALGVDYVPAKVTGGGQAIGEVFDFLADPPSYEEAVPVTIAIQGRFTEKGPGNLYLGKGNFQFVDHVTGMCFHARLVEGGINSGRLEILQAPVKDCRSKGDRRSEDGHLDDGFVDIAVEDSGVEGAEKEITVLRFDEESLLIYSFKGVLKSGNIKFYEVKGEE
jgi:hypothetical protein